MKTTIVCLLACLVAVNSMEIRHRDCRDEDLKPVGQVKSITIEPCDEEPCKLIKGKSASVTIKFTPSSDITSLNAVVHGHVGIWVSFPLENPDACKGAGLTCPLKAGTEYTYTFSLPISKMYPSISLAVRWQLQDQDEKNQVCAEFAAKLSS